MFIVVILLGKDFYRWGEIELKYLVYSVFSITIRDIRDLVVDKGRKVLLNSIVL